MNWVSVAELLERQVPVHASEAVAVVAELCTVLIGRGVSAVPDAADVLISDDGKLAIRGEEGDSNCAAMGRMLHSLLAETSTPAPLRLFIMQAISSERYQSVQAFADALAAYEVPGRDKLIQAVYARWFTTRTQPVSAEIPTRPEPAQESKAKPASKAASRGVPRWAIATLCVVIVSATAAGGWLFTGSRMPAIPAISWSSLSSSVPAAIQQALAWINASEPTHVAVAEPEPTKTKRKRVAKRSSATPARPSNSDAAVETAAAVTEAAPSATDATLLDSSERTDGVTWTAHIVNDPPAPVAEVASDLAELPESLGATEDVVSVADAPVYSRAFPGVVPPVILPRQIATLDPFNPDVEASTIELLVDESGEVEQVKLLSRPSPILAAMLLSAAKTWKFRPALNDGHPVKYRMRLEVQTTRP